MSDPTDTTPVPTAPGSTDAIAVAAQKVLKAELDEQSVEKPSPDRTAAQVAQQMLNEISRLLDGQIYMDAIQLTHAFTTLIAIGGIGIYGDERIKLLELEGVRANPWARELIERLNVLR